MLGNFSSPLKIKSPLRFYGSCNQVINLTGNGSTMFTYNNFNTLLYVLLSGLFFSMGVNFGTYFFLYSCGIISFILIFHAIYRKEIIVTKSFWLPVALFAYLAITPGTVFKDLRIAGLFASAFFSGVAFYYFFKNRIQNTFSLLNIALMLSFLSYALYAYCLNPTVINWRTLQFSTPNALGQITAFSILATISFSNKLSSLKQKLHKASLIPLFSLLLLSNSRSAILGVLCSVPIALIANYRKHLLLIVTSLLILLSIITYNSPSAYKQRIIGAITNPLQEKTFLTRLPIWHTAMQGIQEKPFLGHGLREFKNFDLKYKANHLEQLEKQFPYVEKKAMPHPHNIYLATLFSWGIIGTFLFFLPIAIACRYALQTNDYFFLAILAFTLTHGFFDMSLKSKTGALFLFFPLGMVYGSILLARNSKGTHSNDL